jgi:hypothetical protein
MLQLFLRLPGIIPEIRVMGLLLFLADIIQFPFNVKDTSSAHQYALTVL